MTMVDPFIPVKREQPLPGLVNRIPAVKRPAVQQPVTPPRPIVRQPAKPQTRTPQPHTPAKPAAAAPRSAPSPQSQAVATKPPKKRPWPLRLLLKLRIPLVFVVMFAAGLLLQSLIFGQVAILLYGVLAFWRRIPSSTTLTLAGVSLASIIALNVKNPYSPLIGNFAVYAFLLLAVGVVTLLREIAAQNKEASKV